MLLQGDAARTARFIREGLAGHRAVGDRAFIIHGLFDMAAACAMLGQSVRAARLLGAMEALVQTLGAPLAPAGQTD